MSKHIKERQITVLRSRILNYSTCCSPPGHRRVLQHETPFCQFTAIHQRDVVLPGTARKSKPWILSMQRYEALCHALLADINCNINTRVGYCLASSFEERDEARWGAASATHSLLPRVRPGRCTEEKQMPTWWLQFHLPPNYTGPTRVGCS